MPAVPVYPVRVEGRLDDRLSRWLWLVKWLLAIPHFVVLAFLWAAFFVLSVVAFFAILFTGRYPRSLFDFNVGVLRWTWRVSFYSVGALGTDRYPPFTLGEEADYPARLEVAYPERLSRGLALVKWWLLAIPHYLVVGLLAGGAWVVWEGGEWRLVGGSLIGVLVLIAGVALLFTGLYPRGIFDFVLGLNRWVLRVVAYVTLMTDAYPPFRLDMGSGEPGAVTPEQMTIPGTPQQTAPGGSSWTFGRILLVVLGSIATLISIGLLVGGAAALVIDRTQRDDDGFVMSPTEDFTTGAFAIVSESIDVHVDGPDWVVEEGLGSIRIRTESTEPLFVGIGPDAGVASWLRGVERSVITDLDDEELRTVPGGEPGSLPADQTFWVASSSGAGEQVVDWELADGDWTIVAMNADGSRGVTLDASIGAELEVLPWIGGGFLVAGALLLLGGIGLIVLGVRRARR